MIRSRIFGYQTSTETCLRPDKSRKSLWRTRVSAEIARFYAVFPCNSFDESDLLLNTCCQRFVEENQMNKSDLSKAVAEKCDTTPKNAVAVLDAAFDVIAEALKSKDSVTIAGFGTFATKERAAREGINPSTREKIQIPAKTVVNFKPAKPLREL
tara:strand:- start:453 stop:917 length:465 start_codon:yes stop_codon:yes gene_type:complete